MKDITPEKVDLVERAANKRRFLVCKEDIMPGVIGPELVEDEDGLFRAIDGEKLEEAARVLESVSTSIADLVTSMKSEEAVVEKAEPAEPKEPEVAKAESAPEPEVAKVEPEVQKANEEASVAADSVDVPADPQPAAEVEVAEPAVEDVSKGAFAATSVREVAERAMSLANVLGEGDMDVSKLNAEVSALLKLLQAVIEKYPHPDAASVGMACKPEDEIAKGVEDPAQATLEQPVAPANPQVEVAKAETEKKVEELEDPVVQAVFTKLEKASGSMGEILRETAERAMALANKATEAGFNKGSAMKEIHALIALLQGLAEKYPSAKQASAADLSAYLNAEHMLRDFEHQLQKFLTPDTRFDTLADRLEAISKQVGSLSALVAKARMESPLPASAVRSIPKTDETLARCPDDYNSPAYREAFEKAIQERLAAKH